MSLLFLLISASLFSTSNFAAGLIEEEIAEQQSQPSYTPLVSSDDALSQILGKEHSGRVHGLGSGPCPSKVFHLPTYRFHNSSFGIGEISNNVYMRSELASMQQKLEILRAHEQAERAREQARTHDILKYLPPNVGNTEASPRENRPSSGASHDSSPLSTYNILKGQNLYAYMFAIRFSNENMTR